MLYNYQIKGYIITPQIKLPPLQGVIKTIVARTYLDTERHPEGCSYISIEIMRRRDLVGDVTEYRVRITEFGHGSLVESVVQLPTKTEDALRNLLKEKGITPPDRVIQELVAGW